MSFCSFLCNLCGRSLHHRVGWRGKISPGPGPGLGLERAVVWDSSVRRGRTDFAGAFCPAGDSSVPSVLRAVYCRSGVGTGFGPLFLLHLLRQSRGASFCCQRAGH